MLAVLPPATWVEAFWAHQASTWRHDDVISLSCKIAILLGNILTPSYLGDAQRVLEVRCLSTVALLGQLATLWLMLRRSRAYQQHRTKLLLVHWACISATVYWSLPLLVPPSMLPARASFSQRLLSFVFRLGSLLPATLAAMHRLPWPLVAACTSLYCAVVLGTWTRPFCRAVLAAEASTSRSMQDSLVTALAAAMDYLTGQGEFEVHSQPGVGPWQPLAHMAAAACSGTSSSATGGLGAAACDELQQGQCLAVASTLCIWLGVFASVTPVLLFERLNKWSFLHKRDSVWLQQPAVESVPQHLQHASRRTFVWMQLLQLQVLLDMPLLLLWLGFSNWSRPAAAIRAVLQLQQQQAAQQ